MKRFKETKIKQVEGKGSVYKSAVTDSFRVNTQVLTTYLPQDKERLDTIAHKFYGDSSKWFIIARANNQVDGTFHPAPGIRLVIPRIE